MSAGQESDARLHQSRRVHKVQRALAAGAVLTAAAPLLWGLGLTHIGALYALTGACVAIPLFLRSTRAFTRGCLIVGIVLIPWGVLGVFIGMFLFWPSALLLLLAALGDPRERPVAALLSGIVGALVTAGAVALTVFCVWHFHIGPSLAQPHSYRAETEPGWFRGGLGDATERLRPYGATSVYGSGSDQVSYLEVRFPDDLPEAQRVQLEQQIAQLPGIRRVELCSVRDCG
ncbi:hypothetical protein [Streptomyces sp. NPDC006463]|uniref:hypothetical protein n=1 Tax=Streptomyces sp. NPDC006463 TaxID=3364746 RepID=UPI0036A77D40